MKPILEAIPNETLKDMVEIYGDNFEEMPLEIKLAIVGVISTALYHSFNPEMTGSIDDEVCEGDYPDLQDDDFLYASLASLDQQINQLEAAKLCATVLNQAIKEMIQVQAATVAEG